MSYVKTLSVQQRQDASAAIRKLLEEGPEDDGYGICYSLESLLEDKGLRGYDLVANLQKDWPLTTGSHHYPVPGDYDDEGVDKWKGEQLALRRSLLNHMLAELELAE